MIYAVIAIAVVLVFSWLWVLHLALLCTHYHEQWLLADEDCKEKKKVINYWQTRESVTAGNIRRLTRQLLTRAQQAAKPLEADNHPPDDPEARPASPGSSSPPC